MHRVSEYRGDRRYRQCGGHIRCIKGEQEIEGTSGRGTQWAVNSEDRNAPRGGLGMTEHRDKAVPRG